VSTPSFVQLPFASAVNQTAESELIAATAWTNAAALLVHITVLSALSAAAQ
jgi:hypothetical protein